MAATRRARPRAGGPGGAAPPPHPTQEHAKQKEGRSRGPPEVIRRRPTLPGACAPSTIGAVGLNFSVRNGKRCTPDAMTAEIVKGSAASTDVRSREPAISTAPSKLHSNTQVF